MDTFTIANQGANSRLDRWLASVYPKRSRSEVQRWIRNGLVTVDNAKAKASLRLENGHRVTVDVPPDAAEMRVEAQAIPLDIVFEDEDLVVVNKPSGLVVHPAPGHRDGTLVNAVLHHCPDIQGIGGEMRPGIVHRLDKDTSGLIVLAKNDEALRYLQTQFKERQVDKRYLALLEGRIEPECGRINVPLGRHPIDRKRQAVFPSITTRTSVQVREALTDYKMIGLYATQKGRSGGPAQFSYVSAKLLTGRTHQLRVHFSWMKHPIVGDTVYGLRKQRLTISRMFLHSHRLTLALPSSGDQIRFEAPLPDDLATLLDSLSPDSST